MLAPPAPCPLGSRYPPSSRSASRRVAAYGIGERSGWRAEARRGHCSCEWRSQMPGLDDGKSRRRKFRGRVEIGEARSAQRVKAPEGGAPANHHKEHIMGFIKSSLFISLDGVIESPETWHFPYFNDEMGAAVGQMMGEADATLLGRTTYEAFADYWPQADPDGRDDRHDERRPQVRRVKHPDRGDVGELLGDQRRRVRDAGRAEGEHRIVDDRQCDAGPLAAGARPRRRAAPAGASHRRRPWQEAVRRRSDRAARPEVRHDLRDRRAAPGLHAAPPLPDPQPVPAHNGHNPT